MAESDISLRNLCQDGGEGLEKPQNHGESCRYREDIKWIISRHTDEWILWRLNGYHSCINWMAFISIRTSDTNRFYITHNADQYRYRPQKKLFKAFPIFLLWLGSLFVSHISWIFIDVSIGGELFMRGEKRKIIADAEEEKVFMNLQFHEKLKTRFAPLRCCKKFKFAIASIHFILSR